MVVSAELAKTYVCGATKLVDSLFSMSLGSVSLEMASGSMNVF